MPSRRSQPRKAPLEEPAAALALDRSPAELRLEALRKERERLLREIGKKKVQRERAEQHARDTATWIETRVGPLREQFFASLRELRFLFEQLLGAGSHLNRREKAAVRRLYQQILPGTDPPPPFTAQEQDAAPGSPAASANDDTSDDPSCSAPKSGETSTLLRAIFRRLAVQLHPDKVQEPARRDALTNVMKEVTRAYAMGDVARLLEIESHWLSAPPARSASDEVARQIRSLLQANQELRRQLRQLTAELAKLERSLPGTPGRQRRSASVARELDELVQQMQQELAQVDSMLELTRRFANEEIELEDFLAGPPPPTSGQDEDDALEQMLTNMLLDIMEGVAPEPDSGRGKKARRPQRRSRTRARSTSGERWP